MGVANELIGSIIGKGGSKIAEIRQMSGANIQISKGADKEPTAERQIQITGSPDSVALAKSLINMSLDLHKVQLEREEEEEDMDRGRRDDRRFRFGYSSYLQILSSSIVDPNMYIWIRIRKFAPIWFRIRAFSQLSQL